MHVYNRLQGNVDLLIFEWEISFELKSETIKATVIPYVAAIESIAWKYLMFVLFVINYIYDGDIHISMSRCNSKVSILEMIPIII